jgi:hypothetical protein
MAEYAWTVRGINIILDDAEWCRCNIYLGPPIASAYEHNCHICNKLTYTRHIIRIASSSFYLDLERGSIYKPICPACISYLHYQRKTRLSHTFEMYKVIRCINPDVAKYILKFIYIPSIINTCQR